MLFASIFVFRLHEHGEKVKRGRDMSYVDSEDIDRDLEIEIRACERDRERGIER